MHATFGLGLHPSRQTAVARTRIAACGVACEAVLAAAAAAQGQAPAAAPAPAPPAAPAAQQIFGAPSASLAPTLSNLNTFGSSALQPGALVASDPLSSAAQGVKDALSSLGLRYNLNQAFTLAVTDASVQGDRAISAYSFECLGAWSLFTSDDLGGTSGWVAFEFDGGSGLGIDWASQSPSTNIGSATETDNAWWGDSLYVSQLAWGQSFLHGQLVVVAGMIDQSNYFDTNAYANSAFGQLQNEALVNSQVLPMPENNFGLTIQWQPADWIYVLAAIGANNQPTSTPPWKDLSGDDVSYLAEIGLVASDLAGLGPGTYRFQPFLATVAGETGGGVGFNFEQKLGKDGPFGAFGRFGLGDETTAAIEGAEVQIAGGLAMQAPFAAQGFFSAANSGYLACGLAWTRPAPDAANVHQDEYALELTYVLQVTPTATLQPDVQVVWDPVLSTEDTEVVFQLSLNLRW